MTKLTFNQALAHIGDECSIDANDVQTRALQRKIWVAEWHIPGCMSDVFAELGRALPKPNIIAEAIGAKMTHPRTGNL